MTEDVQRLVEAVDARDFQYQEIHRRAERELASTRWPLIAATRAILAIEERDAEAARRSDEKGERE